MQSLLCPLFLLTQIFWQSKEGCMHTPSGAVGHEAHLKAIPKISVAFLFSRFSTDAPWIPSLSTTHKRLQRTIKRNFILFHKTWNKVLTPRFATLYLFLLLFYRYYSDRIGGNSSKLVACGTWKVVPVQGVSDSIRCSNIYCEAIHFEQSAALPRRWS